MRREITTNYSPVVLQNRCRICVNIMTGEIFRQFRLLLVNSFIEFQYIREHKNLVLDPKYLFITSLDLIIAKMTLKKKLMC